jgi:predicted Holliday junction resolvase-like endonuclease
MAGLELAEIILAVIIGTLAAIVYSLRVLIMLERRVASMEMNIQKMTARVLREETVIEKMISQKNPVRKVAKTKVKRRR